MISAIIGLIFALDPMSGETGQISAAFSSMEECEGASKAFVKELRDQGLEARYICLDVNSLKSVSDAEA